MNASKFQNLCCDAKCPCRQIEEAILSECEPLRSREEVEEVSQKKGAFIRKKAVVSSQGKVKPPKNKEVEDCCQSLLSSQVSGRISEKHAKYCVQGEVDGVDESKISPSNEVDVYDEFYNNHWDLRGGIEWADVEPEELRCAPSLPKPATSESLLGSYEQSRKVFNLSALESSSDRPKSKDKSSTKEEKILKLSKKGSRPSSAPTKRKLSSFSLAGSLRQALSLQHTRSQHNDGSRTENNHGMSLRKDISIGLLKNLRSAMHLEGQLHAADERRASLNSFPKPSAPQSIPASKPLPRVPRSSIPGAWLSDRPLTDFGSEMHHSSQHTNEANPLPNSSPASANPISELEHRHRWLGQVHSLLNRRMRSWLSGNGRRNTRIHPLVPSQDAELLDEAQEVQPSRVSLSRLSFSSDIERDDSSQPSLHSNLPEEGIMPRHSSASHLSPAPSCVSTDEAASTLSFSAVAINASSLLAPEKSGPPVLAWQWSKRRRPAMMKTWVPNIGVLPSSESQSGVQSHDGMAHQTPGIA